MTTKSRPNSPTPLEPIRLKEIVRDVISWVVTEIKESGSAEIIDKNILEPLIKSVFQKLLPYIVTSSIVFLLVVIGMVLSLSWFLPQSYSKGVSTVS